MICEPAACTAFISSQQLKRGSNLFERLVMEPNLHLKAALDEASSDLIFHNCGELVDMMIEAFAHRLHLVILSPSSSRKLWMYMHLVPKDVMCRMEELVTHVALCGHLCIIGSKCDVLFVPGAEEIIAGTVEAFVGRERD